MVIERQITVFDCSFCQKTYSQKGEAEKCETSCAKLSGSPDISILALTPRTYNVLKSAGLDTVQEVLEKTEGDLVKLKGFGQSCLCDLQNQLQPFGSLKAGTLREPLKKKYFSSTPILDDAEWTNQTFVLPVFLEIQIIEFVDRLDWAKLYRGYQWRKDTWDNGFPDIFQMETQMRSSLQNGVITRKDILNVLHWGEYYPFRLTCPEVIPMAEEIQDEMTLLQALKTLEQNVSRLGVTYLSRTLRFAFPDRAGALDSNAVRVFGLGDQSVNQYQWLTLRARNFVSGWSVFRNRIWHLEYAKWQQILSKIVALVNAKGVLCPHPKPFLDAGLRTEGIWTSADVEMAITTHVASVIG